MKTLDEKVLDLINLNSDGEKGFIFSEYYSHTGKTMFKISNTFTRYRQEKLVLCDVEDGFEHAVDLALEQIEKKREEFFGEVFEEEKEEVCCCEAGHPYQTAACPVHGKMEKL